MQKFIFIFLVLLGLQRPLSALESAGSALVSLEDTQLERTQTQVQRYFRFSVGSLLGLGPKGFSFFQRKNGKLLASVRFQGHLPDWAQVVGYFFGFTSKKNFVVGLNISGRNQKGGFILLVYSPDLGFLKKIWQPEASLLAMNSFKGKRLFFVWKNRRKQAELSLLNDNGTFEHRTSLADYTAGERLWVQQSPGGQVEVWRSGFDPALAMTGFDLREKPSFLSHLDPQIQGRLVQVVRFQEGYLLGLRAEEATSSGQNGVRETLFVPFNQAGIKRPGPALASGWALIGGDGVDSFDFIYRSNGWVRWRRSRLKPKTRTSFGLLAAQPFEQPWPKPGRKCQHGRPSYPAPPPKHRVIGG